MAARDVRVGAFVVVSLAIVVFVIFLIGSESSLFSPHTEVRASFRDVQGLARGSPVRMGGVDIGSVADVSYTGDASKNDIIVTMSVVSEQTKRIRIDSIASVEGRGMLGDKMIVITVGSAEEPLLPEGELLKTKESQDLMQIVSDLKAVAAGAERVVLNLEKTTEALAEESFHQDIKGAVEHLNGVLASLDKGDGYVARLLHDPKEAERLSGTVEGLRRSSVELEQLLRSTRLVVDQVRSGPGLVHEVLYGKESEKAVAQVGGAAEELGLALRGVRVGDSLAHRLLYDAESGAMVENVNQATADLRDIVREVKQGKGTVGALLSDPSVYEDLKILLGNVGRNRSLRALVRYSIRKDEASGRVEDNGVDVREDSLGARVPADAVP